MVAKPTMIFRWLGLHQDTVEYDDVNTDKEQKPDKCNPDPGVFPLGTTKQLKICNSQCYISKAQCSKPQRKSWAIYRFFLVFSFLREKKKTFTFKCINKTNSLTSKNT